METHTPTPKRIAIIGAGIAGSSAAYFVRQELGEEAQIVVFEQAEQIGGRVQEIQIAGKSVELGASIFHSSNRYLASFVELLGLHQQPTNAADTFGIWNGISFSLKSSSSTLITRGKLLLRYGLALLRLQEWVKDMLGNFIKAYTYQEQGQGFQTPEELLKALNLYPLTQQSSDDFFQAKRISERLVQEFITGASRNNYGQDASINAFVNFISLAGAGMAGGYLCSVREGNNHICQGLLRVSNATVKTACRVQQIAHLPTGDQQGYMLSLESGETERFDAVIIATPLESAALTFQEISLPKSAYVKRAYQVTHVTLVVGHLNPTYFGGKSASDLPSFIMTTENSAIPFSSLENIGGKDDPQHTIYKLFSRELISDELLSALFTERQQTERRHWQAYPVLKPMPEWPPFQLGRGLYYVNALESAVSTMETEAMASRNVVNLLKQELKREEVHM